MGILTELFSHSVDVPAAPYAYCPHCGEPGLVRERRLGGNDTCCNGHSYPSEAAVGVPRAEARHGDVPIETEEMVRKEWVESDHKRDKDGKFGSGGSTATDDKPAEHDRSGPWGGSSLKTSGKTAGKSEAKDGNADHDDVIHSKEFIDWFGDWKDDPDNASKVVDEDGKPQKTHGLPESATPAPKKPVIYYHGTPGGEFDEFDKSKLRNADALNFGDGFYFTPNKDIAERYAKGEGKEASKKQHVFEVYLNIRKPFDADAKYTREQFEKITGKKVGLFKRINRFMNQLPNHYSGEEVYNALAAINKGRVGANKRLQELGYDGVFTANLNGEKGAKCMVAFNPEQVKSTKNRKFDKNERNIHKAWRTKATHHAPKGGCVIGGREYAGGEFIPADAIAGATDEEREELEGLPTYDWEGVSRAGGADFNKRMERIKEKADDLDLDGEEILDEIHAAYHDAMKADPSANPMEVLDAVIADVYGSKVEELESLDAREEWASYDAEMAAYTAERDRLQAEYDAEVERVNEENAKLEAAYNAARAEWEARDEDRTARRDAVEATDDMAYDVECDASSSEDAAVDDGPHEANDYHDDDGYNSEQAGKDLEEWKGGLLNQYDAAFGKLLPAKLEGIGASKAEIKAFKAVVKEQRAEFKEKLDAYDVAARAFFEAEEAYSSALPDGVDIGELPDGPEEPDEDDEQYTDDDEPDFDDYDGQDDYDAAVAEWKATSEAWKRYEEDQAKYEAEHAAWDKLTAELAELEAAYDEARSEADDARTAVSTAYDEAKTALNAVIEDDIKPRILADLDTEAEEDEEPDEPEMEDEPDEPEFPDEPDEPEMEWPQARKSKSWTCKNAEFEARVHRDEKGRFGEGGGRGESSKSGQGCRNTETEHSANGRQDAPADTLMDLDDYQLEIAREAGLPGQREFSFLSSMLRPVTVESLSQPEITLWHGTTAANAKKIIKDRKLLFGSRGLNATADIGHAGEYPEDDGADVLFCLRARTAELSVDPNDQVGETVAEGLFPEHMYQSSCTLGSHEIVAAIDMRTGVDRNAAFAALQRGDLFVALEHGATVIYLETPQARKSKGMSPLLTKAWPAKRMDA